MGLTKTTTAMQISHQPRFNTNLTGFRGHSRIYVGLAWFTTTNIALGRSGTVGKGMGTTADNNIIWDNGQFNDYNSFIGFNPHTHRGVFILCSGVQRNLRLSQIGFGSYGDLSILFYHVCMERKLLFI